MVGGAVTESPSPLPPLQKKGPSRYDCYDMYKHTHRQTDRHTHIRAFGGGGGGGGLGITVEESGTTTTRPWCSQCLLVANCC